MKKVLSIALAVAFVFAAMSISVFAATTTENVVGNGVGGATDNGSYTDGVTGFDDIGSNQPVYINFNVDANSDGVHHDAPVIRNRYAIDIEYNDLVVDMTATFGDANKDAESYEYIWNVNTYQYDLIITKQDDSKVTITKNDSDSNPYTITNAFKVLNHSDLPIFFAAKVTPTVSYLTFADIVGTEVTKATAAVNGTGGGYAESVWQNITVTPATSLTWYDVANNWIGANTPNMEIGTLTVTVSTDNAFA